MELLFLALLMIIMATALGSGFPVAFALPGAAIITISLAAASGYLFTGDVDAYFHSGGPGQWLSAGVTNLRGVYWDVERDTLIAIPLFIFMGIMLQRSKIAEDLLVTMAQLFGPIPGGLGISVVFVGALLAATTGIVGATVVAMGLISLPAMLRNNYSQPLATGTIAASGTLGQIIPPSIVLIILADQLASATDQASTARKALHKAATGELSMPSEFDVGSTSAGEMFLGAFVPGLVLVGLYMAFILIFAILRPGQAPAVRHEEKMDAQFWLRVSLTLIPPLGLIFLVLGSIIAGIATVNQAGAIGAAGALIMAGYRLTEGTERTYWPALLAIIALFGIGFALSGYEMNIKSVNTADDRMGIIIGATASLMLVISLIWSGYRVLNIDNTLHGVMLETAKTTSLVFIILLGAAMLTAAFRAFGGEDLVRDFLNSLPGGFWSQFIIVMAVIFVLGFFLDFIEIAVVVVPIVAPILLADPSANITAVWLGVMIGLNIQTSFLTPPFGFALFYLRGVAPAVVKTVQMYKGVIAFICLQLLALGIVGYYPQLANYLPKRVSLLSETSPPPQNPQLQHCLEEQIFPVYARDEQTIRTAIDSATNLDLSYLPEDVQSELGESFETAQSVFDQVALVQQAKAASADLAINYRTLHFEVRGLEREIHNAEAEIDRTEKDLARVARIENVSESRLAALESKIASLEEERATLEAAIPPSWEERHGEYAVLIAEENKAKLAYRRTADDAYQAVLDVQKLISQADAAEQRRAALEGLPAVIDNEEPEAAMDQIKAVESQLNALDGTGDAKSKLSKARRALKGKSPDPEEAAALVAEAIDLHAADIAWRQRAATELAPDLQAYEAAIKDTIGARLQPNLTRDMALTIAACQAKHRDVSLYF